jgi:hypothetical protein
LTGEGREEGEREKKVRVLDINQESANQRRRRARDIACDMTYDIRRRKKAEKREREREKKVHLEDIHQALRGSNSN